MRRFLIQTFLYFYYFSSSFVVKYELRNITMSVVVNNASRIIPKLKYKN